MPRPKKDRIVHQPPLYNRFKPVGIRRGILDEIILSLDEYEAIRLADFVGLDHEQAAEEMEISRSTFTRLIDKARKKIAAMLVEGKELIIEGGNIHFRGNVLRCQQCGHMFNIDIRSKIDICPSCGSDQLLDLAGGFGHGNCCRNRHRRR